MFLLRGIFMFCGKCGNSLPDGVKFCTKCGSAVKKSNNLNSSKTYADNFEKSFNAQPSNLKNQKQNQTQDIFEEYNNSPALGNKSLKNEKSSIPSRILSILICVFFFIFSTSALLVGVARTVLNEDSVKNICSDIELTEIKVEYDGESVYLSDFIMEIVSDKVIEKYGITTTKVDEVLSDKTIKGYIEDVVADYVGYIAFNEDPKNLNASSIIDMVEESSDIIYEETGFMFAESDYQDLEDELKHGNMTFLVESGVEDALGFDPAIIQAVLSVPTMIILIALSVVMLILMLLCNNWRVKYLCAYAGMTMVITGSVLLLSSAGIFVVSLISDIYLLNTLLQSIVLYVLLFGLSVFAVGLVMFILYRKAFNRLRG